MRNALLVLFVVLSLNTLAQENDASIDEVAGIIRDNQLKDKTNDWVFAGQYSYNVQGIDNSITTYLRIEENTTVRMYMLAKTDCIPYFSVKDQREAYVFGTLDPISLETELMGYKAATSYYTYNEETLMNINFGIRWGCKNMLDTDMRLLVFYVNKNTD